MDRQSHRPIYILELCRYCCWDPPNQLIKQQPDLVTWIVAINRKRVCVQICAKKVHGNQQSNLAWSLVVIINKFIINMTTSSRWVY